MTCMVRMEAVPWLECMVRMKAVPSGQAGDAGRCAMEYGEQCAVAAVRVESRMAACVGPRRQVGPTWVDGV